MFIIFDKIQKIMKKLVLLSAMFVSVLSFAQQNSSNNVKRDSDNYQSYFTMNDASFKNNEADLKLANIILTSENTSNQRKQNFLQKIIKR